MLLGDVVVTALDGVGARLGLDIIFQ